MIAQPAKVFRLLRLLVSPQGAPESSAVLGERVLLLFAFLTGCRLSLCPIRNCVYGSTEGQTPGLDLIYSPGFPALYRPLVASPTVNTFYSPPPLPVFFPVLQLSWHLAFPLSINLLIIERNIPRLNNKRRSSVYTVQ